MSDDIYNKQILQCAADISKIGILQNPHATATLQAKICGSKITVYIDVENGKITDFKHQVKACVLGQAAAAIMAHNVIGADKDEIKNIRNTMLNMLKNNGNPPEGKWKSLQVLKIVKKFPSRHDSTMLTFNAVYAALEQLAKKHKNTS